jgi:hypothetical protein
MHVVPPNNTKKKNKNKWKKFMKRGL